MLVPLLPVTVGAIVVVMPLSQENKIDDLIGFVLVYVLGITVLPWLLGWGITRVVRAVRVVRARRRAGR